MLPVGPDSAVLDLGCGDGQTLLALAARQDAPRRLVGVDRTLPALATAQLEFVCADLNTRLPFDDCSFDGAVCHNVIEELADVQTLLTEVARILVPGGCLLLGHSDFDTLVFSATDVPLTRRLVHAFCDAVQPWMTVADGSVGRRLVAVGRHSPLELVETFAWVGHHSTFEPHGPAHDAATLVAANGRRDPNLRHQVEGWWAELTQQAQRGEFFYSLNDYAVLLRR